MSHVHLGHATSRFVPPEKVKEVHAELANDKRLRKLIDAWVGLSILLVKEKRKSTA